MAGKRAHSRNNRIASPVRKIRGARFATPDSDAEAIKEIDEAHFPAWRQQIANLAPASANNPGAAKKATCKGCQRVKPSSKAYCPACVEKIRTGKLKP
ncbi:hypothetical protein ACFCYX_24895 [Streptomyces populi]|uniref:hypothetical protein n=1 Tax=Streptomyces populi TaxID=2058924 RepID=UPI0013A6ADC9|nr:hypothetical protein [Streptomyces populi]